MTAPTAIAWCPATPGLPHPAGVGRKRCALHQAEFEKAMSRYRSAVHSHDKQGIGKHPGPQDEYEAAIEYTPIDDVWTGIPTAHRARIRAAYSADTVATAEIARLANDTKALTEGDTATVRRTLLRFLEVHGETLQILDELGQEPV